MRPNLSRQIMSGFWLLESIIVLLVLVVLAVAFVPNWATEFDSTKYNDVIRASYAVKQAVGACIQAQGNTTDCSAGVNGVPQNQSSFPGNAYVSSVSTTNGIITSTAVSSLNSATFILTPTLASNGTVSWCASGSCQQYGYCPGINTCASGGGGGGGGNPPLVVWPAAGPNLQFASSDEFMSYMVGHTLLEIRANSNIIDNSPTASNYASPDVTNWYGPQLVTYVIRPDAAPGNPWSAYDAYEIFTDVGMTTSVSNDGQVIAAYRYCPTC